MMIFNQIKIEKMKNKELNSFISSHCQKDINVLNNEIKEDKI